MLWKDNFGYILIRIVFSKIFKLKAPTKLITIGDWCCWLRFAGRLIYIAFRLLPIWVKNNLVSQKIVLTLEGIRVKTFGNQESQQIVFTIQSQLLQQEILCKKILWSK